MRTVDINLTQAAPIFADDTEGRPVAKGTGGGNVPQEKSFAPPRQILKYFERGKRDQFFLI